MKEMFRMTGKQLFGIVGAIILLAFSAQTVRAQADVPEPVTFAGTIVIQNTNSEFTPGAPTMLKVATKDLLALIAKAEHAVTNYPSTNFPTAAKLVKTGIYGYGSFSVVNGTNVLLPDVSDLIGFNNADFGVFTATGTVDSTAYSETDYGLAEIYIYDLNYGGSTDLTLDGYVVNTISMSAPNQVSGLMQNSQTFTVKAFGGTGSVGTTNDMENAAISGSFSSKGAAQTSF